jgi:hypothetical protein
MRAPRQSTAPRSASAAASFSAKSRARDSNGYPVSRRTILFDVIVSVHAKERARLRFPGFKAARIVDEVRDAFLDGRFSPRKPPGIRGPDDPKSLYLWTPCGERVYALRHNAYHFEVTTTMRAHAAREEDAA